MSDAFIKAIKWTFLVLFVICGIYGLVTASNEEDVRYLMTSVLSFGAVYMMFSFWSNLPNKVMIASAVVVVIMAFLAQRPYAPYLIYTLTGEDLRWGFYTMWGSLVGSLGFLMMVFMFYKFDDD